VSCRAGVLTLVPVASAHAGLNGQQPGLQFDVASVRPCDPAIGVYPNVPSTGNRFYRGCTSVRPLVAFAYRLPSTLVVAIPPWAITERWTIDARPARAAQLDEMRAMVRHLLATRFAFRSHVERRQIDVYDLVLARRDRTLGPKARRASGRFYLVNVNVKVWREPSTNSSSSPRQLPVQFFCVFHVYV